MFVKKYTVVSALIFGMLFANAQQKLSTKVLVIGGGTGGTAAAIQAARMGVPVMLVEETPWLGGMLSAAGVSATDGNHRLPSGIWREFRGQLYKVYGGPAAVETGWVSNTQFEPSVADSILKAMAAPLKSLDIRFGWRFDRTIKKGNTITGARFINNKKQTLTISATVTIDATEMGDAFASAKVPYDLGMEAGSLTGETVGITETNDVVQDLTYVAILKDYGAAADCTIAKPAGYDPAEFDGACTDYYIDSTKPAPAVNSKTMLEYAKLPNNKYLLNWPKAGNDTYLNIVELTPEQRAKELEKAKATTWRFIYFIQHQLGYKNLGLTNDEFPTADRFALIPYYREGRRVKGIVRYTMRHLAEPFDYGEPLYRTSISVGDYPIDHHHKKNPSAPQHLEFYPVPSFSVPLGALIPEKTNGLIIAEKGISVSNVVNGTTRLQPCVLLTGQAAGVLAALTVQQRTTPAKVSVRAVQKGLLDAGAYLMPYIDVPYAHPHFAAIQRIGATGILKGTGIAYKWANQTWFYPDSVADANSFTKYWQQFTGKKPDQGNEVMTAFAVPEGFKETAPQPAKPVVKPLTIGDAASVLFEYLKQNSAAGDLKPAPISREDFIKRLSTAWTQWNLSNFNLTRAITRAELAVMIDHLANPFATEIDHKGYSRVK
jgi:hypothetical protein